MEQRIIYPLDGGGIAVVIPTGEVSIEDVIRTAVPQGAEWRVVDADEIPQDRTWRDAWALTPKGGIEVDMPRAREIHADRIRQARAPVLAELDVAWMRALEQGDTGEMQRIVEQKQALRDAPADPRIAQAATPEALAAIWPDGLTSLR